MKVKNKGILHQKKPTYIYSNFVFILRGGTKFVGG
jgi:hypothetical protein